MDIKKVRVRVRVVDMKNQAIGQIRTRQGKDLGEERGKWIGGQFNGHGVKCQRFDMGTCRMSRSAKDLSEVTKRKGRVKFNKQRFGMRGRIWRVGCTR